MLLKILEALFDVLAYASLFIVVSSWIFVRYFGGIIHMEYFENDEDEENEESQK